MLNNKKMKPNEQNLPENTVIFSNDFEIPTDFEKYVSVKGGNVVRCDDKIIAFGGGMFNPVKIIIKDNNVSFEVIFAYESDFFPDWPIYSQSIFFNNKLYVVGGLKDCVFTFKISNDIWSFDFENNIWSYVSYIDPEIKGLWCHKLIQISSDDFLILGGSTTIDHKFSKYNYLVNINNCIKRFKNNILLENFTINKYQDNLIITGGINKDGEINNKILLVNIETMEILYEQECNNFLLYAHSSFLYENFLILVGGYLNNYVYNHKIYIYDVYDVENQGTDLIYEYIIDENFRFSFSNLFSYDNKDNTLEFFYLKDTNFTQNNYEYNKIILCKISFNKTVLEKLSRIKNTFPLFYENCIIF